MTATAYDGTNIAARQGKTDDLVRIPAHSVLRAVLDADLERQPRLKTAPLVINARGQAYTADGLRATFFHMIRDLIAAGKVSPGLTFHGLRTTLATWLADGGADTRTIAAALGHATEAMAAHYARNAEKRRRASEAVAILEQVANEYLANSGENLGKQGKGS
jgi:integrase